MCFVIQGKCWVVAAILACFLLGTSPGYFSGSCMCNFLMSARVSYLQVFNLMPYSNSMLFPFFFFGGQIL